MEWSPPCSNLVSVCSPYQSMTLKKKTCKFWEVGQDSPVQFARGQCEAAAVIDLISFVVMHDGMN